MKDIKYISIFLLGFNFIVGCGQKINKTDLNSEKEKYNQKAAELIADIALKENIVCDCVFETNDDLIWDTMKEEMSELDIEIIKMSYMNKLLLENISELDNSVQLSQNFDLKNALSNTEVQIISQSEFENIVKENGYDEARNIIDSKCPNGVYSISKPLFNKDYSISLIYFNLAFSHLSSGPSKYKYFNHKWNIDD